MPVRMETRAAERCEVRPRPPAVEQRDGTYGVVVDTTAGLVSPETLRRVADAAEAHGATVKVTSAGRIALYGVPESGLRDVAERLDVPLAESDGDTVRTVKACPGDETCRYGAKDSLGLALRLDARFTGRPLPAKFKMSVSGCPNSCSSPGVTDLGVIGTPVGYRVLVGGTAGRTPRVGDDLARVDTEDEVVELVAAVLDFYEETAEDGERMHRVVERVGIEAVREAVLP